MQTDLDKDLLSYFTDVDYLRDVFKRFIAAPTLPKRLLVIHGVGGVGKSSLLRVFRLHCKSMHVPVALATGDQEKSALDVLARWTCDLEVDGVAFPSFRSTFEHYRRLHVKLGEHVKKAQDARGRMVDIAGKAASKTAEAAGGALAGAAIGSLIPGIGTSIGAVLGGVLSGMGAEAMVDWLRGFLKQPDIDLLLDPTRQLSDDFLRDAALAADKGRIVLMLDTFEKMGALDDWAREVAQGLPANALFVVSGRAMPNWGRVWSSWMAGAQVEELKPMPEEVMRELVGRYYATMRGGEPAPHQVDAIIRFARGLPMVVTSAVQLWVKYGVEDFQAVKAEIVANLVDRLIEGVPSALLPALEAAAIVRWFDQPILRAVTGLPDVREVYDELRRFPFVRSRVEGFALHDAVREIMDENLRAQDAVRHRELHECAALYFEKPLENPTSEEAERWALERLYHRIRADEETGMKLFQETAGELARYQFVSRLRILMNDANTYLLRSPSSQCWRDYFNARLFHLSARFSEAEDIYIEIAEKESAEARLRAYALTDASQIWTRNYRLAEPGGLERALSAIERSRRLAPDLDSKLALNFLNLRYAYMFKGESDRALEALRQQLGFYKGIGDKTGVVFSLDMLKDLYGLLGNWEMASAVEGEGLAALGPTPPSSFLRTRLTGHNIWHKIWSGRWAEAESGIVQALDFAEHEDYIEAFPGLHRDLGLVLGLQRRWGQSEEHFSRSVAIYNERKRTQLSSGLGTVLGFWGFILARQAEFLRAEECLAHSLSIKKEIQDHSSIPEVLVWMGWICEIKARGANAEEQEDRFSQADSYYRRCLEYRWASRRYFECAALTGLVRVRYSQHEYAGLTNLFNEAEKLAEEYRYHDMLACLHLFKGHVQWSGRVDTWPVGFDAVLMSYKLALLHALRYNRFLLDEALWGDGVATPLIDVISKCKQEGPEGMKLLEALANSWGTNAEDFAPTILHDSLLSDMVGSSLGQAEAMARNTEPGDGTPQKGVVGVLAQALSE